MIIPGRDSQALSAELAAITGRELMPISRQQFPDGEWLIELDASPHASAIIVASTTSVTAHLDLLFLQDAAREAGVEELMTVVPYLGYARQDKAFDDGQPVSVRAVARAISTGTDRVLTVDPHELSVLEHFDVPARAVHIADRLVEPLPSDLTDPLFLAPDAGARDLATTLRDAYGSGSADHLNKSRTSGRSVEITPTDAAVSGRDIILIDDIIATGGTMSEAVAMLRDRGANRLIASCVHPLLADDAYVRLKRAGVDMVYGTDTIERHVSALSAAPAIADALDE